MQPPLSRGPVTNEEANALHAEALETRVFDASEWNWELMLADHSLGWVTARDGARAAGCEWLHVDFDDDLAPFYLEACGFRPARAGLMAL